MPQFKAGDPFQVLDKSNARPEWWGKRGTVIRVMPSEYQSTGSGYMATPTQGGQPTYEVGFDDETEAELLLLSEAWMRHVDSE